MYLGNFENYVLGQPVKQDDPCLITAVKKKLLIRPPPPEEQNYEPYNDTGELPSNFEKFKWIEKLLIENNNPPKGTPGFFIECGANDGEFISATLRIEKTYQWTGLLVEGNSVPFQTLVKRKRNAWAINAAACITEHPKPVTFYANTDPFWSGLSGLKQIKEKGVVHESTVQCIPLYTMLAGIGVDTVDFLNLDVEGAELAVLKTIPYDKVKFKVMAVEYDHVPGKQRALVNFLRPRGYVFVKELRDSLTFDCLFVHESLYELALKVRNGMR